MSTASLDIEEQDAVEMKIARKMAEYYRAQVQFNPAGRVSGRDFTLWIPKGIEVKCDMKAGESGNLFFETYNCYRNEPSGLTATDAWQWIHYMPHTGTAFRFCPKTMLSWLRNESGIKPLSSCGDCNSDGYLVPIDVVRNLKFVTEISIDQ